MSRIIDDLCEINNTDEFPNSLKYIYPKELELKREHQDTHATFPNLDISIEDGKFIYKIRLRISVLHTRMQHLFSNILSSIFHDLFYSKLLRMGTCTILFFWLHTYRI